MERVSRQNDKTIFLVDDDPVITGVVTVRLEAAGFRVIPFAYAEECIEAIDQDPDLIILDYYFIKDGETPMNGMEAYDEIVRLAPHLPVIMLSAQERGEVVLEFARKGIADYVIKDSDLTDNLLMSVKSILDR